MDEYDEQLLRGRVYGAEHDDPGPRPGHEYRELVGGPLDGLLLDVTGWETDMLECGAALVTELGHYGGGAAPTTSRVPTTRRDGTGRATPRRARAWVGLEWPRAPSTAGSSVTNLKQHQQCPAVRLLSVQFWSLSGGMLWQLNCLVR
ncbi:hypothetical protein KCH_77410 [Kitasatospora cheerisanensis KCTC 2395]|uniref:Uncharacterized protein n=1 Tax=Kitasatospora cheerisanensis KCTC 2395 TaxID=1348663 RepID=A0A066YH83_9ACTN|nr:hypothetical protein KCH_77410 [Kitasatospora cheerisanensis KCTC 2395]